MATMADLNNIARPGVLPPGGMPGGAAGGGVLPGIPPGMDKEAEQMWNELTRMAKEDPEKYDEFVSGQMKDAKKAAKKQEREKPKPAICVESWGKQKASSSLRDEDFGQTSLLVKEGRRLVVSICGSDKVPPLSSTKDGSVPILLRDPVEPPGDSDRTILWQAVFHPGVIVKAQRDPGFKKDLIGLCWDCVADKMKTLDIDTARSKEVTAKAASEALHKLASKEDPPLIPPGMIPSGKGKKQRKGRKAVEPTVALPGVGPKRWPAGTVVTVTGLKNAAQHNGKRGTVRSFIEEKGRYLVRLDDGEAIRLKPDNALLEEMPAGADTTATAAGEAGEDAEVGLSSLTIPGSNEPAVPTGSSGVLIEEVKRYLKHTIQRSSESGSREMIVSIPMPGRKNAKGVDLSVSATELNLEGVPGFEPLHVQLPAIVDTQDVRAKFDKAQTTLRVTLQVISEHAGWDSDTRKGAAAKEPTSKPSGVGSSTAAMGRSVPTTTAADFAALGALLGGGNGGLV